MKLPKSERFVDEDGESFLFTKASDAPGQVGALYVPAGKLTLTTKGSKITNSLPLGFKFYANAKVAFDQDRIKALRDLPREPHTTSTLALPVELGRRSKGRDPCGFFMPLFEKHKGLDACFPYENYIDLCDHKRSDGAFIVAANLAFAVHHAHTLGLTIGDFNPKNFMVDPKTGLVRVIDVDGMQFFADTGKTYLTDVIQPEYPTPYLRGRKPLPIEHDHFGLAMLIFRILNLGAHPFYLKRSSGRDTSPDHNVKNRLYGYAPEIAKREKFVITDELLKPSEYSGTLARMFTEAFTSEKPPTAYKWHQELSKFVGTLKPCSSVKGHMHPLGLPCYLCAFEKRSKKRKSLYRGRGTPAAPFKLATKENILIGVEEKPKPKPQPKPSPKPAPAKKPVTSAPKPKPKPPSYTPSPPAHVRPVSSTTPSYTLPPKTISPPSYGATKAQDKKGFFSGSGGLIAIGLAFLLLLGMCSGSSKEVVHRTSGIIWYANNSTNAPSSFFNQLRSLSRGQCRNADVAFDLTSFYPGSSALPVTRNRLSRLQNQIRSTSRSLSFDELSFSTRTAGLSKHPRSASPSSSQKRGRSIVVRITCRR